MQTICNIAERGMWSIHRMDARVHFPVWRQTECTNIWARASVCARVVISIEHIVAALRSYYIFAKVIRSPHKCHTALRRRTIFSREVNAKWWQCSIRVFYAAQAWLRFDGIRRVIDFVFLWIWNWKLPDKLVSRPIEWSEIVRRNSTCYWTSSSCGQMHAWRLYLQFETNFLGFERKQNDTRVEIRTCSFAHDCRDFELHFHWNVSAIAHSPASWRRWLLISMLRPMQRPVFYLEKEKKENDQFIGQIKWKKRNEGKKNCLTQRQQNNGTVA